MAHKLLDEPIIEREPKRKWYHFKKPNLTGKFGFSLFTGRKEIFLGIAIAEVEIEQVIKKRLLKTPKGTVKVFRFD